MTAVLIILISYLLGSIPTGMLIAKMNGVDVTSQGSGNIGATNIARTIGKKAGIFTLLADIIKGAAAVTLAKCLTEDQTVQFLSGLSAVVGHSFSFPGIFKGGKGVATSLGVLLSYHPIIGLVTLMDFILVFYLSGYVSLGSIAGALTAPLITLYLGYPLHLVLIVFGLTLTVIAKHHENIRRLVSGTEGKFATKR